MILSISICDEKYIPASFKPGGLVLTINSGQTCILLGPNGSGKTTLIKSILGVPLSNSSQIDYPSSWRIGFLMHTKFLYPTLTVRENLNYSMSLVDLSQLKESVEREIQTWKLESFIDKKIEECSQGMRARVALARANLGRPELLLLDEPFGFLDESAKMLTCDYIENSAQTVLITSPQEDAFTLSADKTVCL